MKNYAIKYYKNNDLNNLWYTPTTYIYNTVAEDRSKIKGIKPELSALKNSFVKANQLRVEYSAQKEEDEQLKRLGVNMSAPAADAAAPAP